MQRQASPQIMGILNITPDSFSGDGIMDRAQVDQRIQGLLVEGADIIDIGAESSRPGAIPISTEEELARLQPAVEQALRAGATVSVDTTKPLIAEWALARGVQIINDIGGLSDLRMLHIVADSTARVVIMHMQGLPATMQDQPNYHNVVREVGDFLEHQVELAGRAGICPSRIILDPGIGFGKAMEHNLALLRELPALRQRLPLQWLVGVSRKGFIGRLTDEKHPANRLHGTLTANVWAAICGVDVVRVHDVAAHRQALAVLGAIMPTGP